MNGAVDSVSRGRGGLPLSWGAATELIEPTNCLSLPTEGHTARLKATPTHSTDSQTKHSPARLVGGASSSLLKKNSFISDTEFGSSHYG
jgi:hypothetical protein